MRQCYTCTFASLQLDAASWLPVFIFAEAEGPRQHLEDEEAKEGREINGAQQRWHQPPEQVQVRVRHLCEPSPYN